MMKKIMLLAFLCSPFICQGMTPSTGQAAQTCLACLICANKVADCALTTACGLYLCTVIQKSCQTVIEASNTTIPRSGATTARQTNAAATYRHTGYSSLRMER